VPPVEILLDSAEFCPVSEDGLVWLTANVPVSISGNRQIALSHRNAANVDCGFTAKVPEGYKLVVELSPEKREHGLEVYKNTITGESRVSLSVRNLGREIAVVNHRDRVALLRIEPIYPLTFKVMEN
jgi:dUTPase